MAAATAPPPKQLSAQDHAYCNWVQTQLGEEASSFHAYRIFKSLSLDQPCDFSPVPFPCLISEVWKDTINLVFYFLIRLDLAYWVGGETYYGVQKLFTYKLP